MLAKLKIQVLGLDFCYFDFDFFIFKNLYLICYCLKKIKFLCKNYNILKHGCQKSFKN